MSTTHKYVFSFFFIIVTFFSVKSAYASLSLTAGNNATTTVSVATSITGFQIVGPAASTTPVKLRATSGTLTLNTISGVTMSGNNSSTVNLSGTVANLNSALSTLRYTRGSTGTDTLEVSLVEPTEVFFADNGHLYKFTSGSFNWANAKTAAEGQTAYGATGYLATITSTEENSFVYQRISGNGWLGTNDIETEKTWKWVTGPEAGTAYFQENPSGGGGSSIGGRFHGWASGEPNDYNSGEDCGYMYATQNGEWNDFPCSTGQGYVVEFGATSSLPTVVAQNITIVTANVPAITTLFPANGATNASTTVNLAIGFSKTVTKNSGNILIKKTSDDSVVDTIDASGSQVGGSGSGSVTIDPAVTFTEGERYYVSIPNTAFKDASNNFYEGFSASTTWSFTIADVTAPTISNVAATSTATTTATMTWDTNEAASTKVVYSVNNSFGSSTSESDTSSRVLSHTKSLSNLAGCTTYNYKVVSADAAGNYATSTHGVFTTSGCPSYAPPVSATTTSVTVNTPATSTLSESGRTLDVVTPQNFTSTSSSVVIQIRSIEADPVIEALQTPANMHKGSEVVFDVKALVNGTEELDSFDHPVTMAYTYTDEDITELQESSLWMYHYHDNTWEALDDCSVNAAANTITCTTPNFSIFGVFGSLIPGETGSRKSGGSIRSQVHNLVAMGNTERAEEIKSEWKNLFPNTSATNTQSVVRDLELGMIGDDVRALQKLLNAQGYLLATTGVGSVGNETNYFGTLTKNALSKYQAAHGVVPTIGYFGPLTRAKMKSMNFTGLWW